MQENFEKELYRIGIVILGAMAAAIPLFLLFVSGRDLSQSPCLFWRFFGLYCPGCGGTRSVDALLHGHMLQALWYHPLVPYMAGVYLAFMISWTAAEVHLFGLKRGMKFRPGYMYGMLVIIGINFLLKNVLKMCFGIVMI